MSRPKPWLWSRLVGIDIANAARTRKTARKERLKRAIVIVNDQVCKRMEIRVYWSREWLGNYRL